MPTLPEIMSLSEQKIFIIGLPRTATTSVCIAMLELGFKTAHTAYTQKTLQKAQVIADTPVFCDFQQLAQQFPDAIFINLTRKASSWLPSIKQLLLRMATNVLRDDGGYNPHIKRCYQTIFSPFTVSNINSNEFLLNCYQQHQQSIQDYFQHRPQDLLSIDVNEKNSYSALVEFLANKALISKAIQEKALDNGGFVHINIAGKVTAWNDIKHPLKISSTKNGRIDKCIY